LEYLLRIFDLKKEKTSDLFVSMVTT
jgi:hypothetical protein